MSTLPEFPQASQKNATNSASSEKENLWLQNVSYKESWAEIKIFIFCSVGLKCNTSWMLQRCSQQCDSNCLPQSVHVLWIYTNCVCDRKEDKLGLMLCCWLAQWAWHAVRFQNTSTFNVCFFIFPSLYKSATTCGIATWWKSFQQTGLMYSQRFPPHVIHVFCVIFAPSAVLRWLLVMQLQWWV